MVVFFQNGHHNQKGYLKLECRKLKNYNIKIDVSIGDVFSVKNKAYDLVYLDPPYTKRQYASYYHILETIAFGDEPIIEGVSGLRPGKIRHLLFCYKRKALITLSNSGIRNSGQESASFL
ncbi:DNA adenine methylase [Klebsiella pneumoniae subsp. pneumoniae]|nr:DNA adenine methylase [Klebsiella pneumoniae subsp. pneumoniae]